MLRRAIVEAWVGCGWRKDGWISWGERLSADWFKDRRAIFASRVINGLDAIETDHSL